MDNGSTKRHLSLFGHIRRFGGFSLSIALGVVVNVAVIPVVISHAGAQAWAGIAVAQSIAAVCAILILFGWGTTGPSQVASLDVSARGQFYADSLASRWWLLVIVSPFCLLAIWWAVPNGYAANALSAVALLVPSLGASWFFIGEGSPWRLLLLENVPRALGSTTGMFALMLTHDIRYFSGAQAAGAVLSAAYGSSNVLRRHPSFTLAGGLVPSVRRLTSQAKGMVAAGAAALYVNIPLVAVSSLSPSSVDSYALADKLMKFFLTGISPAIQVAQGYVPSKDPADHRRRAVRAFRAALGLGLISSAIFATVGSVIGDFLSGNKINLNLTLLLPLSLALFGIATSAIVGLACLTSFGQIGRVATSTVLGALVGVPLVIVGALAGGAVGAAWAAATSEIFVAAYQIIYFSRILRSKLGHEDTPTHDYHRTR
ncbi:hypothetical protein [Sinomonas albida]|uniref:hypothetical protein n=1 Tax=Sinomonas albida TaxID=369942 RepID=UPI0010A8B099|nr:hypothetical protein [Sinomonas albida]